MQKMLKFSIIEFVVIENESFKVHPPKTKNLLKQYFLSLSWLETVSCKPRNHEIEGIECLKITKSRESSALECPKVSHIAFLRLLVDSGTTPAICATLVTFLGASRPLDLQIFTNFCQNIRLFV